MKYKKSLLYIISSLALLIIVINSCSTYLFRENYISTNALIHKTSKSDTKLYLKIHLKNGDVCILTDTWVIDSTKNTVSGNGTRFNFNRYALYDGKISVPIDSVAIFETNKKLNNPESARVATLAVLASVDVIVGLICLTNPKACFGSCPTFYINEKDNFHYADAEGFTNAISPSMEYGDIDALNNKTIKDNLFSITMKNEALETHCVNDVKLLAYPRNKNERVFHTPDDKFYLCQNIYTLDKAKATEGEVTSLLKNDDKQERFSLADADNLNTKEEILFNFNNVNNTSDLGLIINFRQTLLTTYLFYSAMGYMGDNVGDIFAKLETDKDIRADFNSTTKVLGNIEVYVFNDLKKNWIKTGEISETGPIAINKQFLPLNYTPSDKNIKMKIVLNKGLWRIDYLALTNIKKNVKPLEISPNSILNKGKIDNNALTLINDPAKYLVSMPGSEYKFNFILPEKNQDYELFLFSKGYYLEWMRQHWLKDKDIDKLKQMVYKPEAYLKSVTKDYKLYETKMEEDFWNSKIDTKTYSFYEN